MTNVRYKTGRVIGWVLGQHIFMLLFPLVCLIEILFILIDFNDYDFALWFMNINRFAVMCLFYLGIFW